jgi:anti-anti-sigma factor
MDLSPIRFADIVVLAPKGRVDHGSADTFRTAVEPWLAGCKAGGHGLVFDMAGLEYISSAGLRVLMLASKQARPTGGRIAIAALTPLVAEIFKISRFDMVFPTHPGLDAALAALSAEAAAARASGAGAPATPGAPS